jgi:hypothetical protein
MPVSGGCELLLPTSIVLELLPFCGFFFFVFKIYWIFVANWFDKASCGSFENMNSVTARKFWWT